MRKATWFLAVGLFLSCYSVSRAELGLPPTIIFGPFCEAGSKIQRTFNMYVDRDGNGVYDYIMLANGDGTISGHNWNPSVGQGSQDHEWTVPVGGPFRAELASQQCQSGSYSWDLAFVDVGTNITACTISGDCTGQITSTCELLSMLPPTTGGRQSTVWERMLQGSTTAQQQVVPWRHESFTTVITVGSLPATSNQTGVATPQLARPNVE